VINLIAVGATAFLLQRFFPQTDGSVLRTPPLDEWSVPLLERLPKVGPLFVQSPLVFIAVALVVAIAIVLWHTPAGLALRAVGEGARAADTAGINVALVRYVATIVGGALAGLGGACLSLVETQTFQPNMTAGRGFIALAVVMLGRWRPGGALAAALLFGAADALQFRAQGLLSEVPPLTWTMLPYLLTLVVLVVLVGRLRPPAEDGIPYVKEGR
jgi:simple sugar transport system permease protein